MKTVLIVDDSASMRQVCNTALTRAGYNVVEASDGRAVLAQLSAHKVHLIISDVNMPGMDGLTFAREVKAQPAHKFMPIIMLTTESGGDMKAEGRAACAGRAAEISP